VEIIEGTAYPTTGGVVMRWIRIIPCAALAASLTACGETGTEPPGEVEGILLSNNGATVNHGLPGCSVLDANGQWFPVDCGMENATYSQNGNATIEVDAKGVPNETGKTVHWGPMDSPIGMVEAWSNLTGPPYPCFVFGPDYETELYTLNWKNIVTPSGRGKLVCHYAKKWEFNCEDHGNCAPDE
jgi:hypothetical protein